MYTKKKKSRVLVKDIFLVEKIEKMGYNTARKKIVLKDQPLELVAVGSAFF